MGRHEKKMGGQVLTRLVFPLFCFIIIGILAYWTYARNEVWTDPIHLWMDCVKKSPQKARPYNNVGTQFMNVRSLDMAALWIEKAVSLDPKFPEAQNNLGILLAEQGRYQEAIDHLRIAEKYQDHAFMTYAIHNNIGIYLVELGKYDEGIAELKEALRLNPYFDTARNNLDQVIKNKRGQ